MKKSIKVAISLICVLATMTMGVLSAAAAIVDQPTVEIQWNNTQSVSVIIGFNEGQGSAECSVAGQLGTTRIRTSIFVYRQAGNDWVYLAEAHNDEYDMTSGTVCPFSIMLGETYRADYAFVVTKDGTDEIVTRIAYRTYTLDCIM